MPGSECCRCCRFMFLVILIALVVVVAVQHSRCDVCFQLRVCEDTVCPLLSAGVMFQMPDIVKSCCTFLEHQLDPSESYNLLACSALLISSILPWLTL